MSATYESTGTYFSNSTATPSIAVPSGVVADDIIIVELFMGGATTVTAMPTGFAHITGSPITVSPGSGEHRAAYMWKRATGADSGTYDFTVSGSQFLEGAATRYSGAITTGTPFEATTDTDVNNTDSLTTTGVSLTTSADDRLLIHASTGSSVATWTAPSGFTRRVQGGFGLAYLSTKLQASAGATGSVVATVDAAGKHGILLAAMISQPVTFTVTKAVIAKWNVTGVLSTEGAEDWIDPIFDAIVSDAQISGYFDKVNQHEPKKAPRSGLTAAVWLLGIRPLPLASGLAATSALVTFRLRIYSNMLSEPTDDIDPNMMRAASNLIRRYHDDFDFAGAIRNVDLLGAFGVPLSLDTAYLEIDKKLFRISDITIPCIVESVWPQIN